MLQAAKFAHSSFKPGCRPRAFARLSSASRFRVTSSTHLRPVRLASFGKDAVDGWLDVASLVSSGGSKVNSAYSDLAYAIGRDVYADVAGWHLYFRDLSAVPGLKAHDLLANLLGPQLGRSGISEQEIVTLLKKVPIKLGAGKLQVSLFDVVPRTCVQDLVRIAEDFAKSR